MTKLNLSNLEKSVESLKNALESYQRLSTIHELIEVDILILRAGVIKNFEVTYEQCWKFMKRWIEVNVSRDIVDGVSRKELFRIARENKLIIDIEPWFEFHELRNLTSHTYDISTANDAFLMSFKFYEEAANLLSNLEKYNA